MVWMQGENDAFADMSASWHKENLTKMVKIKKENKSRKMYDYQHCKLHA